MLASPKTGGPESMKTKTRYPQEDLGQRIEIAIEETGLSKAEMGRRLGVTRAAVSDMCRTGRISKHRLQRLAMLTGKSFDYFLTALRVGVVLLAVTLAAPEAAPGLYIMLNTVAIMILILWLFTVRESPTDSPAPA
jgi:transcriptional regulator with XRE-family HTH domain